MKVCTQCKEEKSFDNFWKNRRGKNGLCAKCIPCATLTPAQKFATHIKYRYNLTVDQWHSIMIAQQGRCGICEDIMLDPVVDHCHKSGKIREFLCRHCNIAIGAFFDRPDAARNAAHYLEKYI